MSKKDTEFKRNICFSFFEDYRLTAKEIEEDFGKAAVADFYNAIIDYALYEQEPILKGAVKYVWPTIKTTIDKSIEKRSCGFGKTDVDKTNAVLKYLEEHPNASQREVSKATNISLGKVNSVFKTLSNTNPNTITNTNTNTITNTTLEREREHPKKSSEDEKSYIKSEFFSVQDDREREREHLSHLDQSNQIELTKELKKKVIDSFQLKNDYGTISKLTGLTGKQIFKIINDYLSDPNGYFYEQPVQRKISFINEAGTESYLEAKDIRMDLETKGDDIMAIEECLREYYNKFISNGADKYAVDKFFEDNFKYTTETGYNEKIYEPENDIVKDPVHENHKRNSRDISRFLENELLG